MTAPVIAIVPMKDMSQAKTRLAPHVSPRDRCALAACMLEDVLSALSGVRGLATIVITTDARAQRIARAMGHETIDDEGQGETAVVAAATAHLVRRGAIGSLVVPGDVPLVTDAEVGQILGARPARGTVLVPSRSMRGTNAVLRSPPDLYPLKFGDDSFEPHRAEARKTRACSCVLRLPGLGLDVDDADDLRELVRRPARTRTHAFLAASGIAERLSCA